MNATTRHFANIFLLYSENIPPTSGWWIGRVGQHYWPLRSPDLSHICSTLLGVHEGFSIAADVDTPYALLLSTFAMAACKRTNLVGSTRASHSVQTLDRMGFETWSGHFEHS